MASVHLVFQLVWGGQREKQVFHNQCLSYEVNNGEFGVSLGIACKSENLDHRLLLVVLCLINVYYFFMLYAKKYGVF